MQLDVITLSIYRLMIDSAYRIREKCDYSNFLLHRRKIRRIKFVMPKNLL